MMRRAALATVVLIALLVQTRPASAQERYSAFAVNLGEGSFQTTLVEVSVERWSDAAEQAKYLELLRTQGALALYEALRNAGRAGHLSMPGRLEIDVEYAETTTRADGSRRMLLVGYRNVGLGEQGGNTSRSRFRFVVIELRLKPKGDGDGVLAMQADLSIGKNGELRYQDFTSPSIQLKKVKSK
jgi:hypothetical protein